jgi:hypothetical protein
MTQNIELTITPALTKARIIHRIASAYGNPLRKYGLAPKLADELHGLVGDVLAAYKARPPHDQAVAIAAIEQTDLVDGILRTAVGLLPEDEETATQECCWVDEQLISLGGDLYKRFAHIATRSTAPASRCTWRIENVDTQLMTHDRRRERGSRRPRARAPLHRAYRLGVVAHALSYAAGQIAGAVCIDPDEVLQLAAEEAFAIELIPLRRWHSTSPPC